MFNAIWDFFKGRKNSRILEDIQRYSEELENITFVELEEKTKDLLFRMKTFLIEKKDNSDKFLEEFLIEVYAISKDFIRREKNITLYPTQILGSLNLNDGNLPEKATGEGKTLIAAPAACLNASAGMVVYIVTTNDFLAKRDWNINKPLFDFFNIESNVVLETNTLEEKKNIYNNSKVIYTTPNLLFDYLNYNLLCKNKKNRIEIKFEYVIIDEIDSSLIDNAQNPLRISTGLSYKFYKDDEYQFEKDLTFAMETAKFLIKDVDYRIDIQKRDIFLNDSGIKKIETNFNLNNFFSFENYKFNVLIFNSLKALFFFKRGVDYIVDKDNKKIQIIDGSTGRISKNRVYRDGIQQAIEVKEGLKASKIRKTITEITYPSFFRMFKKISGMSGTAKSEENEFKSVYGMNVVKIHSYNKLIRRDKKDIIFPNNKERSDEVLRIIKDNLKNDKRPIFIGVHDLETSEHFSSILKLSKIDHYKINAENHEQEAEAVAKAGEIGSITIATVMGGRGTDIVLSNESKEKGGLKIIVIGKSVISDRIDKQFIGRGGRKGDPGESQFFLSLEDDLFKKVFDFRDQIDNKDVFSPVRKLANEIMKDPAVSIFMCDFLNNFINGWLLKFLVSNCQNAIKLEMYINRKNTLEYSLLTNKIRKEFYEYREEILMLEGDELIRFILEDDNFHIKVKDDTLYEQLRRLLLMNSDNFWSKHLNSAERKLETIFIKSYFPKPPQEAFFLEINEDFRKNFKTFKLINKVIMLRKISDNFKETNQ